MRSFNSHNRNNPYWWAAAFVASTVLLGFLIYSTAPEMLAKRSHDLVMSQGGR
jgi:hypothetical protein